MPAMSTTRKPSPPLAHRLAFGNRLRELRSLQDISQEELGHRSGPHRTFIGKIERGEVSPSLDTIHKLARGLGIDVHAFFTRE